MKNITFNPKMTTASNIINHPDNIGLEYVTTHYINEYEAVIVFKVAVTKIINDKINKKIIMSLLNKLLLKTDLSIEQQTAVRGQIRILKTKFIRVFQALVFVMPLGFSLVLYSESIYKAIFWAILSIIGYQIFINDKI